MSNLKSCSGLLAELQFCSLVELGSRVLRNGSPSAAGPLFWAADEMGLHLTNVKKMMPTSSFNLFINDFPDECARDVPY